MLGIAAKYIRDNDDTKVVFYDGAECDGFCVAEDCENAIDDLIDSLGYDPRTFA